MTNLRTFSPTLSSLWARQLAVAVIYGLLVWVVLDFITPSGKSSMLFLASGFALATILLGGRRYALGILLGALCVNLLFGYTPITAVAKSLGSTLSALFGAWLLMRDGRFDRALPTLSDYLRLLLLGGCVASILSALIGTAALLQQGVIGEHEYARNLLSWWLGDTLGVVLLAPLCLLWWRRKTDENRPRWYEIAAIAVAVFLGGQLVFMNWFAADGQAIPRGYWMFFFIFVAAIRLPPRWTALMLLMAAVQGMLGAYYRAGYFSADKITGVTVNYWFYMNILSMVGMTLGIYLTQRRRIELTLRQRTEELSLYNMTLGRIHEGKTLAAILDDLAREVERIHPEVRCSILLLDAGGRHLRHGAAPSLPDFYTQAIDGLAVGESMGACGTAAQRGERVVIVDIAHDALWPSRLFDVAQRAGLQSCWSQPIRDATHRVMGTFALYHPYPAMPSEAEVRLLERLSDLAALAIEQTRIQENLRLKDAMLDMSADPTLIADKSGHIVWANRAFSDLTGYATNEVIGRDIGDIAKSDKMDPALIDALWETILSGRVWRGDLVNRMKDGTEFHQNTMITPIRDAAGEITHFLGVIHDISERKRNEERIHALAFFDTLTQLPNRRLLDDRLRRAQAASKRSGHYAAVLFLDLDNFKPLNDTHGHSVGDLLLIEVARRLTRCVRATDTVARFGGDEFVVLLDGLDVDREKSAARAMAVAEKIRLTIGEPYSLTAGPAGEPHVITHRCAASIGVVLFTATDALEDVLEAADRAMYRAKQGGRNLVVFDDNAPQASAAT
jgi:diguanylate cyclase (GGDEF)-like protein/PAS domain S-box-containing protein